MPQITAAGLVDAASYAANGVAPGEIVVLFGATQGPAALATAQVVNGRIPGLLSDTQVFFDGVAAPLLYSWAGQVSAIVPFGVASRQQTAVQYQYQGIQSNVVTVPVVAAKPGIFTLDASGKGQAAALDANTVHSLRLSRLALESGWAAEAFAGSLPPGISEMPLTIINPVTYPSSRLSRTASAMPAASMSTARSHES